MRQALTTRDHRQRGAALLLCLFALLLLSAIGAALFLSSGTEKRIAANYGNGLDAYYAAKYGLQEVRDRVNYTSNDPRFPNQGGLADGLPTDIAGNSNGVLYILNAAAGEAVDPTNINNRYFDDQLCHDYASGVPKGAKCNVVPAARNWALPNQASLATAGTASALKWVRVNKKTNRTADPFFVDATNIPATLDLPVCWDGAKELLSPAAPQPACDANGLQNVYMLTSLAVTPGLRDNSGRRLLRSEVVAPSIRPPGAITMDANSAAVQLSDGSSVPQTKVDGRPHALDGTLQAVGGRTPPRCSAVAAVATDQAATSTSLMQSLNNVRFGIVQTANSKCNADGTLIGSNGTQMCAPNLWWVRGTDASPRFVTSVTVTTSGEHHGNDSDHSGTTSTVPCDSSLAACYTNLNLASPELYALSATMAPHVPAVTLDPSTPAPFTGGPGNQPDPSIYQTPLSTLLASQVSALGALVTSSTGQANYFLVAPSNLAASYGSQTAPVVVQLSGQLALTSQLSGYGVLVVPNDLEINAGGTLQWNGIVLVQGGNAQFKVGAGSGFINGALMLQPLGSSNNPPPPVNLTTSSSGSGAFTISYSCDAVDLAFSALPFKIVASSEVSY